jgi:hypothetical protein
MVQRYNKKAFGFAAAFFCMQVIQKGYNIFFGAVYRVFIKPF